MIKRIVLVILTVAILGAMASCSCGPKPSTIAPSPSTVPTVVAPTPSSTTPIPTSTIPTTTLTSTPTLSPSPTPTVSPTPTLTSVLSSIVVTPTAPTILAGATKQFTASGIYSDDSTKDITSQVTWTSSNVYAATISSIGLATGISNGSTGITASLNGVTSFVVLLTVKAQSTGGGNYRPPTTPTPTPTPTSGPIGLTSKGTITINP